MVDSPGGGGKIALQPNYLISQSTEKVVLRNFEGVITSYPESQNYVAGRAENYVVRSEEEGIVIQPITSEKNGKKIIDYDDSKYIDPIYIDFEKPINFDISHSAVINFSKYLLLCKKQLNNDIS